MDITLNYWPECQVCQTCANAYRFVDNTEIGCQANITLPSIGKIDCHKFIDEALPDLTEHLVEIQESSKPTL